MQNKLRVCLVKQNTTYDLYTCRGVSLQEMIASSNWRTGPIGLWEAFDTSFVIVWENPERECQLGKRHWSRYVEDMEIWPIGCEAVHAGSHDWSNYDIVICIDVAIPSKLIKKYPNVMWCYYFIEGGTGGIDFAFRGSPYFMYNVFFTHRPSCTLINTNSRIIKRFMKQRRIALDIPYYIMSSTTIQKLYNHDPTSIRTGIMLENHSYPVLTEEQRVKLSSYGEIVGDASPVKTSEIHKRALKAKYFIVLPGCTRKISGLSMVEAISAGCLCLASKSSIVGFPELINPSLNFESFEEMLSILEKLHNDDELYLRMKIHGNDIVDKHFFNNPVYNIATLYDIFTHIKHRPCKQYRYQILSAFTAMVYRSIVRAKKYANRLFAPLKKESYSK